MYFDWDPAKAHANLRKNRVSFEMAVTVFDDPLHLSILDSASATEERWVTIGLAADKQTLVVVHTYQTRSGAELLRIISARLATKHERRQYEKGV